MRLDKYLKVSRLIKRRTVANEACDAGRVLVNDKPAKASVNVKEGDIIALENGKLTITDKSAVKAVVKLAKSMVTRDTSFITLIYGEDTTEEDAEKAYEELRDKFGSRTDISLVKGDQPVYYFILSVE